MQDGYSAYSSIFQLYQQEQEVEEEEAEKSQQQMTVSGKSMQTATRVTEMEAVTVPTCRYSSIENRFSHPPKDSWLTYTSLFASTHHSLTR